MGGVFGQVADAAAALGIERIAAQDLRGPSSSSAKASPSRILTSVVLPAPLGPIRPKIVPGSTEMSTPRSASTGLPRNERVGLGQVRDGTVRASVASGLRASR